MIEIGFNGPNHKNNRLVEHLGQQCKTAYVLHQRHNGLFVSRANRSNALSAAHLLALLDVAWPLDDGASIGDMAAPLTSAQVAFAPWLLAAHVLVKATTSGFVRINMQVNALVADR